MNSLASAYPYLRAPQILQKSSRAPVCNLNWKQSLQNEDKNHHPRRSDFPNPPQRLQQEASHGIKHPFAAAPTRAFRPTADLQ